MKCMGEMRNERIIVENLEKLKKYKTI